MLHKLNSALSLLASLLLLAHMILTGSLMLGILNFLPWFPLVSKAVMLTFILHAVLSCYFLFTNQAGAKTEKYASLNRITYVQRISAIALVALMPTHFFAFTQYQLASMISFLLQILLVLASGIHMGVSIPKAFVGLGVVAEDKAYKKVSIVSLVMSAAASVYSIVGFCVLATHSGIL